MNGRKTAVLVAQGRQRLRRLLALGCSLVALSLAAFVGLVVGPALEPARLKPAAPVLQQASRTLPEFFQAVPLPVAPDHSVQPARVGHATSDLPRAVLEAPAIASAPPQAAPPVASAPVEVEPAQPAPSHKPHRVPFASLAAWSKPGLCSSSSADAARVQEQITESFTVVQPDDGGKFYLDPRLAADAAQPILADLRQAEAETMRRLALRPKRPLVFVYADQQLMKAAACINENVVAFYDGALHVVANRADVRESLVHEYTHHALFSSGFITPAWAQEGIAMNLAKERWWREPRYLQALLASPFTLEQMDRSIAYKLPTEQAIAFYVQAAVTVECLLQAHHFSPADLLTVLRTGANSDALTYDLPELEQSNFLLSCLQGSTR